MRSRHLLIAATATFALALGSGPAFASPVTFSFTGVFSSIGSLINSAHPLDPGSFSGTFTFPSGTTGGAAPGSTNFFNPSPGLLSISTDYGTFSLSDPALQVISNYYSWKALQNNGNYGNANVKLNGNPAGAGGMLLQLGGFLGGNQFNFTSGYNGIAPDITQTLTDNLSSLSFVQIQWTNGQYGNDLTGNLTSIAQVTSTTPLPPSLPLALSGLGLFALLAWRRKRQASPQQRPRLAAA